MKHSTGKPTKADVARFERLHKIGCIACLLDGMYPHCGFAEMHHVLSGNKRRGHQFTLPLGPWHHRGVRPQWIATDKEATRNYGPSLAHGSKPFTARYGTADKLLAKVEGMMGGVEAAA